MSSITSAASRWPLVASSSRLAASRRRADAGSYTISGGAGGATRTASARRTHSRASINDGRGARRGGDGQHQGADRLKAPQPNAGDSTEEQAGQRTPDAGRDGSAGGCADLTFAIRDHRRRSPPTPVLVYSRPGAPNARPRNRRPPTPAIPSSSRLSSVMLRAFGRTAQTTEPNPLAGRAGQAPFIEILLSTPPSPTIAPLVTAQGWDDLGHAMDSGSIKDVSRLELDVHGRSRMKLPEIAFRLSHLNGNPDRAGVAGPMIGVVG